MRGLFIVLIAVPALLLGCVALALGGLFGWSMVWRARLPDAKAVYQIASLPPAARPSTVILPVMVPLATIQAGLEAGAPREFSGSRPDPLPNLIKDGRLDWALSRGPIQVGAENNALNLTTPLTGNFRIAGRGGSVAQGLGSLLGGRLGQQIEAIQVDQSAALSARLIAAASPRLTPAWRVDPRLSAKIALGDVSLPILGARVSLTGQLQPQIDGKVAAEVEQFSRRFAEDKRLEILARGEWAKACRSIKLPPAGPDAPPLFIEVKPVGAIAGQPGISNAGVNMTLGLRAETRVLAHETKPECPFPAQLELLPGPETGRFAFELPVEMPFTEVNRLVSAAAAGQQFPKDGQGPAIVTVKSVAIRPAGPRLLVKAGLHIRQTGWPRVETDADAVLWARPVFDAAHQVIRLTDIDVDATSDDMHGVYNLATAAAGPYLRAMISEKAVFDLKPFAAEARAKIEAAIATLEAGRKDVKVALQVTDIGLSDIAFDDKTLRVVGEAKGSVALTIQALPF